MAVRSKAVSAVEHNGERAIAPASYLALLGERVRDARSKHGMTRKMLARDSGISERYLAELETGRGNCSIALLKRVASAIEVPVSELVSDELPRPVEYALLIERLRRFDAKELTEAAAMLADRFGDRSGRTDRIALIGLRGAGKSTLGAQLARHLGWSFVELSREIEIEAKLKVDEVFDLWGQAAYRRYERRALERIVRSRTRVVLAAGGGLVSKASTLERLLDSFYTIWLQASPEEHWDRVISQGDHRVEASGDTEALSDMRRILAQRNALYGKADARVNTSGKTPRQTLARLIAIARKLKASDRKRHLAVGRRRVHAL